MYYGNQMKTDLGLLQVCEILAFIFNRFKKNKFLCLSVAARSEFVIM